MFMSVYEYTQHVSGGALVATTLGPRGLCSGSRSWVLHPALPNMHYNPSFRKAAIMLSLSLVSIVEVEHFCQDLASRYLA